MKRIITLLLLLAMLTSLVACAATAAESAPSEAPAQTDTATPSPTAEPTPTPEPTPEPLTEGQQMFFTWLESPNRGDIYACLVAYKAYKNHELDSLIDSGEITEEDIVLLDRKNYNYCDFYEISLDDILNEVPLGELSGLEIYFKLVLGLPVDLSAEELRQAEIYYETVLGLQVDLSGLTDPSGVYLEQQNVILRNGHTAFSAFTQESQEKINEMMELYRFIQNEEMFKEFDDKINGSNLNSKEKLYVMNYILDFDTNNNYYSEPTVTYNGEKMGFIDYVRETDLYGRIEDELKVYINEAYPINATGTAGN